MTECIDCHRTGFTAAELAAHKSISDPAEPGFCEPLEGRFLREHYLYDAVRQPDGRFITECGVVPDVRGEEIDALRAELAQLRTELKALGKSLPKPLAAIAKGVGV